MTPDAFLSDLRAYLASLPAVVIVHAQGFDVQVIPVPAITAAGLATDQQTEEVRDTMELAVVPVLIEEARRRGLERVGIVDGLVACRWCSSWTTELRPGVWGRVHAHQMGEHVEALADVVMAAELADLEAGE